MHLGVDLATLTPPVVTGTVKTLTGETETGQDSWKKTMNTVVMVVAVLLLIPYMA